MQIPRFNEITTLAYAELLRSPLKTLPIRHMDFADNAGKKIIIVSFQDYIKTCGADIKLSDLTLGADFNDGYALHALRPGLRLILYNKETNPRRLWFTLYHEVGHFICAHNRHGDFEEVEANFFASQLLMPNAVIRFFTEKSYAVSAGFLMDCFGVSAEAAEKKMNYLRAYGCHFKNAADDAVIERFQAGLERQFPLLSRRQSRAAFYGGEQNYQIFAQAEQAFMEPDF
ncbi:MAG: ImmA/IrrE family metallo-endopeptidase [Clostridiales bacterium]|nr:ImmA/IrrE family metallo-endopeptidase [Clostridiales bacterium]